MGPTKPEAGVMATKPATTPDGGAQRGGTCPGAATRHRRPGQSRGGRGGQMGDDEGAGGQPVGGEGAAGVEAEPAEPEDARAQHRHGDVVRMHGPPGRSPGAGR